MYQEFCRDFAVLDIQPELMSGGGGCILTLASNRFEPVELGSIIPEYYIIVTTASTAGPFTSPQFAVEPTTFTYEDAVLLSDPPGWLRKQLRRLAQFLGVQQGTCLACGAGVQQIEDSPDVES